MKKKELVALLLFPEREVLLKITPSYSPRELEGLLTRELYENVKGCNYEHALKIVFDVDSVFWKGMVAG